MAQVVDKLRETDEIDEKLKRSNMHSASRVDLCHQYFNDQHINGHFGYEILLLFAITFYPHQPN